MQTHLQVSQKFSSWLELLLFLHFSKIWLVWWEESLLEGNLSPHIPLSKPSCSLILYSITAVICRFYASYYQLSSICRVLPVLLEEWKQHLGFIATLSTSLGHACGKGAGLASQCYNIAFICLITSCSTSEATEANYLFLDDCISKNTWYYSVPPLSYPSYSKMFN